MVTEASRDPGAFRLLAKICAAHIFRSEVVPESAKNFAALVLTGQTSFPKQSPASKTFSKNLFLLAAAEACARDFSLSLTRNDEAKHATSACDAVSEALSALGFGVTWRAIKELFTHKSSTRLRISAEQIRHEVIEIQEQFPEAAKEWARMVNRKLTGTEWIAEPPP